MTYEVGQFLPAYEAPGIVRTDAEGDPVGGARWHALLVYPQRERAAKAWLNRFSIDAFFPVEDAFRWRRNRMVRYERCYLPGYLFAHFPGTPLWHRIIKADDRRLVHDVIRMSDGITPGVLHPDTLVELEAMRDMAKTIEAKRQAKRALRPGDRAKFNSGPFAGYEVEIVKVNTASGKARFLQMVGAIHGEASIDALDKIEEKKR